MSLTADPVACVCAQPDGYRPNSGAVEGDLRAGQEQEAPRPLRHGPLSFARSSRSADSQAYQGFASGDIINDAFALRYFVEQGHQILLCQSFAKNLGLYGERAGTFSMIVSSAEEKERVLSQIKRIIRPLYSSPPMHGAQIVATILSNKELYEEWLTEVKKMADRIIAMRERLYDLLVELQTPGEWGHIKSQIGMFSFTGSELREELPHCAALTNSQRGAGRAAVGVRPRVLDKGRADLHGGFERGQRQGASSHPQGVLQRALTHAQYFAESLSKVVKGELKPKASL